MADRAQTIAAMQRWVLSEVHVDDSEAEAEAFAAMIAERCLDMAVAEILSELGRKAQSTWNPNNYDDAQKFIATRFGQGEPS